jgi:hypothetical protein
MVDAPISISESRSNPASATDRADRRDGEHHDADHVPAQCGVPEDETPPHARAML